MFTTQPACARPHTADRSDLQARQRRQCAAYVGERRPEVREELLARFSRGHATRRAREQSHADLLALIPFIVLCVLLYLVGRELLLAPKPEKIRKR